MICERHAMTPALTSIEDISREIDHVACMIDAFRVAVKGGDIVDLSGVDRHVETLCANIAAKRADARDRLKRPLLALIDNLNGLVETLEAQQCEITENVKSVSSRHRAASAYKKGAGANAVGPDKKPG